MPPPTFSVIHRRHVQSLYKRLLKNALDWKVDRVLWREEAFRIRAAFEANRDVTDPRQLSEIMTRAELYLTEFSHPDPYIPPTAPGGTKWERNLPPRTEAPFEHEKHLH